MLCLAGRRLMYWRRVSCKHKQAMMSVICETTAVPRERDEYTLYTFGARTTEQSPPPSAKHPSTGCVGRHRFSNVWRS